MLDRLECKNKCNRLMDIHDETKKTNIGNSLMVKIPFN